MQPSLSVSLRASFVVLIFLSMPSASSIERSCRSSVMILNRRERWSPPTKCGSTRPHTTFSTLATVLPSRGEKYRHLQRRRDATRSRQRPDHRWPCSRRNHLRNSLRDNRRVSRVPGLGWLGNGPHVALGPQSRPARKGGHHGSSASQPRPHQGDSRTERIEH